MRTQRRPVWVLDTGDPTGATIMALRRRQAGSGPPGDVLVVSQAGRLPGAAPARSWYARARIAAAHRVITAGPKALAAAARLARPGSIIHYVHERADRAVAGPDLVRYAAVAGRIVLPPRSDCQWAAHVLGVEPARIVTAEDFALPAQSLLSTARERVFIAIGRARPDSGTRELLRAFALVASHLPDWRLRLIGVGAEAAALSEEAMDLGVEHQVTVVARSVDVGREIARAGVLVHAAAVEADGLAVVDALAAGLPVVGGSEVPAVGRLVRHDDNGLILDRTDVDTLASALRRVADDDLRLAFAASARQDRSPFLSDAAREQLIATQGGGIGGHGADTQDRRSPRGVAFSRRSSGTRPRLGRREPSGGQDG